MKKYSVAIPWHATVFVEVEADSKEDAIEKATAEAYPSICNQCISDGLQIEEMNHEVKPDVSEV